MSDLTSVGPLAAVVDVADDVADADVVDGAELAADVSVTVLVSVLVVAVSDECPQAAEVRARAITAAPTTYPLRVMSARYQPRVSYRKRTTADLMS